MSTLLAVALLSQLSHCGSAAVASSTGVGRAAPATVSLTHGLTKIRPDVPVPANVLISSISAARNEYESFQVVVEGPAIVRGIAVDFPALGPGAALVHRENYINISVVSNCAGALGRWPDALIPAVDPFDKQARRAFPITVQNGANQAFWVDVWVRNETAPGTHSGSVTVKFGVNWTSSGTGQQHAQQQEKQQQEQQQQQELPLSIKVHSFALPSISRYATTFNCGIDNILTGRFLGDIPSNITRAQRVAWQKQYVDLGLMHRVTFSDFLGADPESLGLATNGDALPVDWAAVERDWGSYLGSAGAPPVDTPFGLRSTRVTTIQLPAMHYPGSHAVNRSLVDDLWHGTGCTNPTPGWGYAYWSSQPDYGVSNMLEYCRHSAAGDNDPLSRTCAPTGAKVMCTAMPNPHVKIGPVNNSAAVSYWRDVAAHSKSSGWWSRIFDYTCDEPGAGAGRYPACEAHASAIHGADPGYKVMITAEKPSADSVNISSEIDIWAPLMNFVDSPAGTACGYPAWATGNRRSRDYDSLVAEGKGLWWYQSCMSEGCASSIQPGHPAGRAPGCRPSDTCTGGAHENVTWPSYMIDAPATYNRVMSWMSYKYNIQGELYWGANYADYKYSASPFDSSWEHQWFAGGNGDGSLTYPGRPDHIGGSSTVPIASLRLKQIRDGLEDLEYMYLLQDATGSRDAALAIVSSVVHATYHFEHSPEAFIRAREKLGAAVEAALLM